MSFLKRTKKPEPLEEQEEKTTEYTTITIQFGGELDYQLEYSEDLWKELHQTMINQKPYAFEDLIINTQRINWIEKKEG